MGFAGDVKVAKGVATRLRQGFTKMRLLQVQKALVTVLRDHGLAELFLTVEAGGDKLPAQSSLGNTSRHHSSISTGCYIHDFTVSFTLNPL